VDSPSVTSEPTTGICIQCGCIAEISKAGIFDCPNPACGQKLNMFSIEHLFRVIHTVPEDNPAKKALLGVMNKLQAFLNSPPEPTNEQT
jgi:hypothetical protein